MADATEKKSSKTFIVLACLILIVLIAAGAAYLFRGPAPESETERAAAQIARMCAGGNQLKNESEVAGGLGDQLTKLSGRSKVTSSDIGTLTANMAQNGIGKQFYDAYRACLKESTESWLRLKGIKVEETQAADGAKEGAPGGRQLPGAAKPGGVSAQRGIAVGGNVENSNLSVNATDH